MKRLMSSTKFWMVALFLTQGVGAPPSARAEMPDVNDLLVAGGFSASDIEKAKAGSIIRGKLPSSNERELVATLAFVVQETPKELLAEALDGLLMHVDRNVVSWEYVKGAPSTDAFVTFELSPDGKERAKRYGGARVDTGLNLSPEEVAAFRTLGSDAPPEAVEPVIRKSLAERMAAYQKRGLKGIAAYARDDGEMRSVGDDLRDATEAADHLVTWMPAAYKMFLDYPSSRAAGSQERFAWSQIVAHDVPTIVLTHSIAVPDGDAWFVLQRQFYVSEGYNCEQALAAFIPIESGTAVFYVNRTSTDQVTGFGGSAKRSIGSKMLASQLEEIFKRVQK